MGMRLGSCFALAFRVPPLRPRAFRGMKVGELADGGGV